MQAPRESHEWPTSQQVMDHFLATKPQPRSNRTLIMIGVVTGLGVFAIMGGSSPLAVLLPWLLVFGLIGYVLQQRHAFAAAQKSVQRANELTMLRQHEAALRDAWRSLTQLRRYPAFYAQAALLMAANLIATRRFEAALTAHDHLLTAIPPDHPVGQVVSMQRVLALLHEDRLADAEDALRKAEASNLHTMGRAMSAIGRLYQQLRTNQLDAIVEAPEHQPDKLRPLGYDAAYGYGMIAAAMKQRGRDADAARWWKLATLLMPPATIMNAVHETRTLAATPPAQSLNAAMQRDGLA